MGSAPAPPRKATVMNCQALRLDTSSASSGFPNGNPGLSSFTISDEDAREFVELIYNKSGIVLAPNKKAMIVSRLSKRLRALALGTFREYLDYLQHSSDRDAELVTMIAEITTNKTAFFRESHHFDYLSSAVLPLLARSGRSPINIWSAGCSTGEEPYTLAMTLTEFFGTPDRFTILAIDLSTQALQSARLGIYTDEQCSPIPSALRRKYVLGGRGPQRGRCRIVPELRDRVRFGHFNLIDRRWDIPAEMDIIFCRNVMIYFDKKTRSQIVSRFGEKLRDGGHFFVGHSETLSDLNSDFVQVRPTVYSRRSG